MATRKRCPKGVSKTTGKCLKNKRPRKSSARKSVKRGNCKKFGRSPTTGKCRKAAPVGSARRAQASLLKYGAVFG